MENSHLEKIIEQERRKLFVNKVGLICHATYFNNIPYILETGLTIEHSERDYSNLPKGVNITLIGYLIEQLDRDFPSIANFELEKGNGVVLLGDPANTHVPENYRRFSSEERPVFTLFEIPDNQKISFHYGGNLNLEVESTQIKRNQYSERNNNMTGMIIISPNIPREWLRGIVIPPQMYVYLNPQLKEKINERTLKFLDVTDNRIEKIKNKFGKALLVPQDVLVEIVMKIMDREDKSNRCPLYDVNGNCLYNL